MFPETFEISNVLSENYLSCYVFVKCQKLHWLYFLCAVEKVEEHVMMTLYHPCMPVQIYVVLTYTLRYG